MKEERLDKLEASTDDARESLQTVEHTLDELAATLDADKSEIPACGAVEDIRIHLGTVGSTVNAARAHNEATEHDARDRIAVGDTEDLVIRSGPGGDATDDDSAFAYNEHGISTFIKTNGDGGIDPDDLAEGSFVRVRFITVWQTAAEAIALETLD